MDDLVARLRACLDTDEWVALAATVGPWTIRTTDGRSVVAPNRMVVAAVAARESWPIAEDSHHIARHDPARVLRWVKAAREILRRHEPIRVLDGWACDDSFVSAELRQYEVWPCRDVLSLMSVYGDEAG